MNLFLYVSNNLHTAEFTVLSHRSTDNQVIRRERYLHNVKVCGIFTYHGDRAFTLGNSRAVKFN